MDISDKSRLVCSRTFSGRQQSIFRCIPSATWKTENFHFYNTHILKSVFVSLENDHHSKDPGLLYYLFFPIRLFIIKSSRTRTIHIHTYSLDILMTPLSAQTLLRASPNLPYIYIYCLSHVTNLPRLPTYICIYWSKFPQVAFKRRVCRKRHADRL